MASSSPSNAGVAVLWAKCGPVSEGMGEAPAASIEACSFDVRLECMMTIDAIVERIRKDSKRELRNVLIKESKSKASSVINSPGGAQDKEKSTRGNKKASTSNGNEKYASSINTAGGGYSYSCNLTPRFNKQLVALEGRMQGLTESSIGAIIENHSGFSS